MKSDYIVAGILVGAMVVGLGAYSVRSGDQYCPKPKELSPRSPINTAPVERRSTSEEGASSGSRRSVHPTQTSGYHSATGGRGQRLLDSIVIASTVEFGWRWPPRDGSGGNATHKIYRSMSRGSR